MALGIMEFFPAVKWFFAHLDRYQYVGIGIAAYIAISFIKMFNQNREWMQTFSHEMTHTIVGLLFLRKIHSFSAGQGSGEMSHSGGLRFGDIFISLAPYCLPIFTFAMFLFRELSAAKSIYIFDILIGFTLAFHIDCFRRQTGNHQTDISKNGYTRSYMFILAMLICNLTIILESVRRGLFEGIKHIAIAYWDRLCDWCIAIFNLVISIFQ